MIISHAFPSVAPSGVRCVSCARRSVCGGLRGVRLLLSPVISACGGIVATAAAVLTALIGQTSAMSVPTQSKLCLVSLAAVVVAVVRSVRVSVRADRPVVAAARRRRAGRQLGGGAARLKRHTQVWVERG